MPQAAPRVAFLFALAAVFGAGAVGASAAPRSVPSERHATVAIQSFEGSLDGWQGYHADLSLADDGVDGEQAARVALRGTARDFSIFAWPYQVDSTVAGATYQGDAWVRSATPGRSVCLRLREWTQDLKKLVVSSQTCVKTTTAWRRFPSVQLRAKAAGHSLDLYAYEAPAKARDSFEIDVIALTDDTAPPPPQPPALPDPPAPPGSGSTLDSPGIFSQSSIMTTPIPPDPPLSPQSDAQVASIVAAVQAKGWALGNREWNATLFHADASTPWRTVRYVNYSSGNPQPWYGYSYTKIPIPDGAFPTPDSDHKMVIVDDANGCVYDLGGYVTRQPDGSWTATAANGQPITGSGVFPSGNSASASGFSYGAGMFTPREIAAGHIDHALTFAGPMFNGYGVFPATSADAWEAGPLPEGARVQLDPALNLDDPALSLKPWQKTIARALQVYGMYGIDWGGAVALTNESADSGDGTYPWEGSAFGYLPSELAKHLRVLAYGSQFKTTYKYFSTSCNTLYS